MAIRGKDRRNAIFEKMLCYLWAGDVTASKNILHPWILPTLRTGNDLICKGSCRETDRAPLDASEGLMKELVDELIDRTDVYGNDRVEINWRFSI